MTGKVDVTCKVIGPGLRYDSEAMFLDGQTGEVDYAYYPSTGKYYIYGSYFSSDPDANGGKGIHFNAEKGYNNMSVRRGVYFDYSYSYITPIKYDWEAYLKFTLP